MPYSIRKVTHKPCYKLYNRKSKKVFSKCTTKKNALSQMRLLKAIQFNKDFVPRSVSSRKTRKNRN
jgi:hypothetical protein